MKPLKQKLTSSRVRKKRQALSDEKVILTVTVGKCYMCSLRVRAQEQLWVWREAELGDAPSMTNPCSSHGTPSHQRMPQQVNRWAGDAAYPLMTLLQHIYPYIFYTDIAFRSSSRTPCKWYDWAGEGPQARECANYFLHLVPPRWNSEKLIWMLL